ncbi:MAG: PAS domain S-box protein, partial [Desulfosarcinaceae bacterium]
MIENIENYKVGIIGGGRRCQALLHTIYSEPDPDARPDVLAVADTDAYAVGLQYAREKGVFTTTDYRELLTIEDLDVIFELTQDDGLRGLIQKHKPPGVLLVDHYEARALLDKLQIRAKMNEVKGELRSAQGQPDRAEELLETFHRYVTEITEQANVYAQKNREKLLASEGTLAQIVNGSTIATFVIDRAHKVTHWNLACERLTGMPAREVLGTDHQWKPFRSEKRPTMADLILDGVDDEELWRLYASRWERSDLIEGAYDSEEFFPNLGSEGTWLFFSAAPIKGPDGSVIGAIETLQDRTKQKQAEAERERKNKELAAKVEELRTSRQAMSQIINGSTIPTFVIGHDHKITHWNKALERLTGTSAEKMIGTESQWQPFYDEPRPTMADMILSQSGTAQLQDLYGSKWCPSVLISGAWEAELFFPHLGDDGKWLWFTAAPIKTPTGQVVGAIETLWDKTEERQAASEQERHTRELATFCSIYATLSGSLKLQDRINEAIQEAANIFQLDGFCIFLLRPDGQFHLKHSHGFSDQVCFHNRIAGEDSVLVRVAGEGRTKVFNGLPDIDDREITLLRQAGLASLAY